MEVPPINIQLKKKKKSPVSCNLAFYSFSVRSFTHLVHKSGNLVLYFLTRRYYCSIQTPKQLRGKILRNDSET